MLQCFFRRDSLLGIVHEDPLQQIKHLPVKRRIRWDEFLDWSVDVQKTERSNTYMEVFHGLHVFSRGPAGFLIGIT